MPDAQGNFKFVGREREYQREWYHANKARLKDRATAREKKRRLDKYGLSDMDYALLRYEQGGCCAVCHVPLRGGKAEHIDHCHDTGVVRGLLCHGCNVALGLARDNQQILQSMISYLRANAGR